MSKFTLLKEVITEEIKYLIFEHRYLSEAAAVPPQIISKADATKKIRESKGKVFTVAFVKKDGSQRIMNARLGVKSYLKGGKLPYNPADFNYIPVFDMAIKKYRILNLNTMTALKIGGEAWKIK